MQAAVGLILCLQTGLALAEPCFLKKVTYALRDEPIDVVIPAVEKDLETLELCIAGIRENCIGVRDIYVISKKELTQNALWFCENLYPFDKFAIASVIFQDQARMGEYFANKNNRIGWIYQQLLKLYAPFVIPGISSNVLVVDSDTIFLNRTSFLNDVFEPLFNPGSEYHIPYFVHASKLLHGFKRILPLSGISHHMLLQKSVLEGLFEVVQAQSGMEFWKTFSQIISAEGLLTETITSPCSEFEIYFNFMLSTSDQAHVRELKWENIATLNDLSHYKTNGYNYVSAHAYLR